MANVREQLRPLDGHADVKQRPDEIEGRRMWEQNKNCSSHKCVSDCESDFQSQGCCVQPSGLMVRMTSEAGDVISSMQLWNEVSRPGSTGHSSMLKKKPCDIFHKQVHQELITESYMFNGVWVLCNAITRM